MSVSNQLSGLRIFIADDQEENRFLLTEALEAQSAEVSAYEDGAKLLLALESSQPDLIISDVNMPVIDGYELAKKVKQHSVFRFIPFVLLTAQTQLEELTAGFDAGADDYIRKPFKPEELVARVKAALRTKKIYSELKEAHRLNRELSLQISKELKFEDIVGNSQSVKQLLELILKIAESDVPVLISGESGVGKELVARAVHAASDRKNKPFIVQNCAAFNEQLLESELFGHVRGSFTGATRDKAGLFEMADGGTFFLDEIGEMSPNLQAKLLRALQDGTFLPVGSLQPKKVNVRIVAATHRNLPELIKQEKFREDLWYRLNVINVKVPALRERRSDIPILVENFLEQISERTGKIRKAISNQALGILSNYNWPGNIRQLKNEIERAVLISTGNIIESEHLSPELLAATQGTVLVSSLKPTGQTLKQILADVEKNVIAEAIKKHGGNKSEIARELDMSRTSLIATIKEYELG